MIAYILVRVYGLIVVSGFEFCSNGWLLLVLGLFWRFVVCLVGCFARAVVVCILLWLRFIALL